MIKLRQKGVKNERLTPAQQRLVEGFFCALCHVVQVPSWHILDYFVVFFLLVHVAVYFSSQIEMLINHYWKLVIPQRSFISALSTGGRRGVEDRTRHLFYVPLVLILSSPGACSGRAERTRYGEVPRETWHLFPWSYKHWVHLMTFQKTFCGSWPVANTPLAVMLTEKCAKQNKTLAPQYQCFVQKAPRLLVSHTLLCIHLLDVNRRTIRLLNLTQIRRI